MSRFDHRSNFTRNAGINSVVIGSQTPILEVELNEMQEIQNKKFTDFFEGFIGNSISSKDAITYKNGILSIGDCMFIVSGHLIKCTGLSLALAEGKTAYLKVGEVDADYTTELKEEGNQQSNIIVPNNIKDSRYEFATSMRTVITYDLVDNFSTTDGYTYLDVATIKGGVPVVNIEESSVGGGSGSVSFLEGDFGEDYDWEESV